MTGGWELAITYMRMNGSNICYCWGQAILKNAREQTLSLADAKAQIRQMPFLQQPRAADSERKKGTNVQQYQLRIQKI